MIDYIDLFILYLSLLNFKLTLSSIYIFQSDYMPVRYTATHSSFICSLSWFCIWYFSICLFYSFLWSGLAIQTHHAASPVNFRVFVRQPMYIMKCYSIYWWNICTLVTSQPGGAWIAPFTSARHRHVHFEILNLIYVFLFAVWSPCTYL